MNNTKFLEQINCGDKKYLSEVQTFKDGLPKNCLFHKGKTGVGGTTIALNDDYPTVICFPFKSVIDNKVKQSLDKPGSFKYDLIYYYSGCSDEDFKNAISKARVPKILVTYDSLGKLSNFINPKEFNLVIDEYDCLITEYLYRNIACDVVYDNFKKYKCFTFMTATPIPREYLTDELALIRIIEAVWDKYEPVTIIPVETPSILKSLAIRITECLDNLIEGNLYIFVNSLKIANSLIKHCGLNNDNTRLIYSDYNNIRIENCINRGQTTDAPKKINIITKTGFQGCDIDDELGRIIVVSDGNREHTYVDVSITLPQIIGRIRNSKYSGVIHHIFSKNYRTNPLNKNNEDFIDYLKLQESEARKALKEYREKSSKTQQNAFRSCIKKNESGDDFYSFIRLNLIEEPELNERMLHAIRYSYYVRSIYDSTDSLTEAYSATKFNVGSFEFESPEFELIPQGNFIGIDDANQFAIEILTRIEKGIDISLEDLQKLRECYFEHPELEKAYLYFGFKEFKDVRNLHKGNLRKRVSAEELRLLKTTNEERISSFLLKNGLLRTGVFYDNNTIISALTITYNYLGINITAKPSDINNYFIAKSDNGRIIKNGPKLRGYYIINRKTPNNMAA